MCFFNLVCILYDLPSLSYFDLILTLDHKIKRQTKSFLCKLKLASLGSLNTWMFMLSRMPLVTIVSPTIMQDFVVKKYFYFKTPDGAASISSPSYCRAK